MQLIYTNTAWFCRVQYCWVTARYLNINKQVALSCTDKCSSDQCQNLHTLKSRSRLARPHAEIWWTAWPAWICVSAYIGFCVAAAPLADRWPPLGHSITVEKRACRKRILVFETGITSSIFAMKNIQLSKSSKEGEMSSSRWLEVD